VHLVTAIHRLTWMEHPAIWLCESCAILWLVLRAVRSPLVRTGVLLMLCGLGMNALVTDTNAGSMPVIGMPSTVRPASPMWQVRHCKRGCRYWQTKHGSDCLASATSLCSSGAFSSWRSACDGCFLVDDNQFSESFRDLWYSNQYQLSLIHPQLQSVPPTSVTLLTRKDSLSAEITNRNRNINGTRNSKVV
jgi:hypothetical protein